jgi:hypothetical protein
MVGFPATDRDRLIGWKNAVLRMAGTATPDPDDVIGALELHTYLLRAITERRATPGPDLLSALLTGPEPLTDQDTVALCFVFVLAGLDTVTDSIGFALWKLATRPDLRHALTTDRARIPEFIEDLLRLECPVPQVPRVTTQDTTIGGVEIPRDTLIWMALGAANRDTAEQPACADVSLDDSIHHHWAFGSGPHRCLGSHLARLELRLILEAWLTVIPEFELTPGASPHIPYPASTFGFESLPLIYPPA